MYDRKLTAAEVRGRIDRWYHPYHAALTTALDTLLRGVGALWHLNRHSMPAVGDALADYPGRVRAELALGDRDGTTCAPAFTCLVADTVARHGLHRRDERSVQGRRDRPQARAPRGSTAQLRIEIKRTRYMDEALGRMRATPASAGSTHGGSTSSPARADLDASIAAARRIEARMPEARCLDPVGGRCYFRMSVRSFASHSASSTRGWRRVPIRRRPEDFHETIRRRIAWRRCLGALVAGPAAGRLPRASDHRHRPVGRRRRYRRDGTHHRHAAGKGTRAAGQCRQPHRRQRRGRACSHCVRRAGRLHHRRADRRDRDDALAGPHRPQRHLVHADRPRQLRSGRTGGRRGFVRTRRRTTSSPRSRRTPASSRRRAPARAESGTSRSRECCAT